MSATEVWWLQQTEAAVPLDDAWLGAAEFDRASRLRVPKRRRDWLLGRWTAKRALATHLGMQQDLCSLSRIEIRPAPSGAPEVSISNQPAPVLISLSHREGIAMCAVTTAGARLGCDLEVVEPHSNEFIRDYFTAAEQAVIQDSSQLKDRTVALIWSAKESALKALRTGLRDDTWSVSVSLLQVPSCDGDWGTLSVQTRTVGMLHGRWQHSGSLVRTLIVDPGGAHSRVIDLSVLHGKSTAPEAASPRLRFG